MFFKPIVYIGQISQIKKLVERNHDNIIVLFARRNIFKVFSGGFPVFPMSLNYGLNFLD